MGKFIKEHKREDDEGFMLTDKEIRLAMTEAMDEGHEYGDDGEPLPERVVAKAQAKKLILWEIAEMNKRWYELTGEPEVPMENALIDFKALLKAVEK